MDIHCVCGELMHVDAEFAYRVACRACGRMYYLPGYIELIPLTDEEMADEREHGDGGLIVEAT